MRILADSGSTKTDWCITFDDDTVKVHKTQGINPFHMQEEVIKDIIGNELMPFIGNLSCTHIEFYGAGCTKEKSAVLRRIIQDFFPDCTDITVDSDMMGAAKALCGEQEGIACILGTGANSCLFNGKEIVSNVSPMGYILGDEGSGAVIGRTFVNELYKGGHRDFIEVFETETGLDASKIIQRVYREPLANRFLASLSIFISAHIEEEKWLDELVTECFRDFFRKNIRHYNRPELPVNFVGSIAFYYQKQLERAAKSENFMVGRVMKSPL